MRIESSHGKIAVLIAVCVAFGSALLVEFQAVEHQAWFRVLKNGSILLTAIGWVITWQKMKPFVRVVRKDEWWAGPEGMEWRPIVVQERQHKKGKLPRIDFMRLDRSHFTPAVEYVIEENGDIRLSVSRYASIGAPDDFFVRISA